MFKMQFRTDRGEIRDVECAMIDVFFNYADGRYFSCTHVYSHEKFRSKVTKHTQMYTNVHTFSMNKITQPK